MSKPFVYNAKIGDCGIVNTEKNKGSHGSSILCHPCLWPGYSGLRIRSGTVFFLKNGTAPAYPFCGGAMLVIARNESTQLPVIARNEAIQKLPNQVTPSNLELLR